MTRHHRIAVLINRLDGGGAEKVAVSWATGLQELGHQVTLLTYDDPEGRREFAGLPVQPLLQQHTRTDRWLRLVPHLRAAVRAGRYDALVSCLTFPNLVAVAALAGLRECVLVLSEHNLMTDFLRQEGVAGLAKHRAAQLLYRRADAVVAVSHPVAAALSAAYGVPRDRLYVLPNPIPGLGTPGSDPHAFDDNVVAESALRLLFVGRLVAQKMPERVLLTAAALRERGRAASVTFVGAGPLADSLQTLADRHQVPVRFTGWLSNWREQHEEHDVLVLPSDHEGFGNVLVEAAAVGLPVVASSQALGAADAVAPGITGTLALTHHPDDLADAVLQAHHTARRAAKAAAGAGLSAWLARHDPAAAAQRLATVIERALAGSQVQR